MRLRAIGILSLAGLLGCSTPSAAITIVGNFLPYESGPDSDPTKGGGNINAAFDAAAQAWESAILDTAVVTIDYYWEPIPNALAYAYGNTVTGTIAVTTMADWFLDATPELGEEYSASRESLATLNGMTLLYGTGLSGGTGAADGTDLVTVLLHEIGHVLAGGPNVLAECSDGDVDVTAPRPFAGVAIPTSNCFHVGVPDGYLGMGPALSPFLSSGERRFISDADLLYVAQNGGWQHIDIADAVPIPEPATLILVSLGLGAAQRRRNSRLRSATRTPTDASRDRRL